MKRGFTLLIFIAITFTSIAQNFTGQWKGVFSDNSVSFMGYGGDKIDYVIELESEGSRVHGYSYTYFSEGDKKYYTICKVKGKINSATKEVIVTEYERTKYNTPKEFQNCFQTHRLTYFKNGSESESLEGTWIPAPDQTGNCGYGKTVLARRMLKKVSTYSNRPKPQNPITKKDTPLKDLSRSQVRPPVAKSTPSTKQQPNSRPKAPVTAPPVVKNETPKPEVKVKSKQVEENITKPKVILEEDRTMKAPPVSMKFEKRTKSIVKTIEIETESFTVDLYDNGDIDGDTVSVFYNGKLLLSNQRLSDKPLTIKLTLDEDREENELTMYAENLGEIPPNTALMVVRDGSKRYETRITSDNKKNGTIAFVKRQ